VTTLDDVRRVRTLEPKGVTGLIIGKALYAEKFTFDEAVRIGESDAERRGA
jgi:phosphoribosylformimino-5-aminoimidazole carboxamide ribonucleotide (ProFAR) isomerase